MASLICPTAVAFAQEKPPAENGGNFNLESATLGGKQFWTDRVILANWRIQEHVTTRHCRLLDERDVRHAWGTLEECQQKLDEVRREKGLMPPRGKVVIALHGVLRSRGHTQGLCDYLEKEGGYTVVNFTYASSRGEMAEHAAALAGIVDQCKEAHEINFVAHSMGNLVVRNYLGDQTDPKTGKRPDPRIKRIVMLGPPNNGAELAVRFANLSLFQTVWGKSGRQLSEAWGDLQKRLATPACEFGIIAGGRGDDKGFSPLIGGDDDFVVGVSETKLPGAADFLLVPKLHSVMLDDPQVRKATLSFLKNGYFLSAEKRQPLPARTIPAPGPAK
jgi:pimeloyl-ACP methyl ester carboxylesterase